MNVVIKIIKKRNVGKNNAIIIRIMIAVIEMKIITKMIMIMIMKEHLE